MGSTRVVLGDDGQVKESIRYDAYGVQTAIVQAGTENAREKFTGKELDREGAVSGVTSGIGLDYFGARYYDPEVGIWTGTDPAEQFWNSYSYCGGNPINFTDPDGLKVDSDGDGTLDPYDVDLDNDGVNDSYSTDHASTDGKSVELAAVYIKASSTGGLYGDGSSSSDHQYDDGIRNVGGISISTRKTSNFERNTISESEKSIPVTRTNLVAPNPISSKYAEGSGTSPLLQTIRATSTVNDALMVGSLGLLLVAPLGAVALTTTGIIGTGLGLTDAYLSGSRSKALLTGVEAVAGFGAGKLALKAGGYAALKFNFGASRYISGATGRFVGTAVGRSAFQLEGAAGSAASIPFMLSPDDQ